MNINIEDYLTKEEIKSICESEVREHVRTCVGDVSVSNDVGRVFVGKLAKQLAKEGVQEIIPDFKEFINEHIKTEIGKITLSDFFVSSFGWSNTGNKVLNGILTDNKQLIDAKIKEVFKTKD